MLQLIGVSFAHRITIGTEKQYNKIKHQMSFLTTQLFTHRRQISTAIITPTLSSINTLIIPNVQTIEISNKKSNFHTTTTLQRPGYKPPRNPKIGITLEQLRMAARGTGRRLPICHDEMEKVMNSLEAAKYEVSLLLCICDMYIWHMMCAYDVHKV